MLNPADDPVRKLLAEGLDLCVRGRKLDQVEGVGATPWLWVQEQYEKDLIAWEDRTRKALLTCTCGKPVEPGFLLCLPCWHEFHKNEQPAVPWEI